MGKRKSKQKVVKKVNAAVAKVFDCPFCNHSSSVECKINKKENTGLIRCRICSEQASFATKCLTMPVDLYHEWLDAIEDANKAKAAGEEDEDAE